MDTLQLTRVPTMNTGMLIRRPVGDVFEAFVNPDITTQFWGSPALLVKHGRRLRGTIVGCASAF